MWSFHSQEHLHICCHQSSDFEAKCVKLYFREARRGGKRKGEMTGRKGDGAPRVDVHPHV